MKAMLAAIIAAVLSIFGGHQAVTNSASNAAAAAASVAPSEIVAALSTSTTPISDTNASSTIVYQTINQPIIERIIDQQSTSTSVSESELTDKLNALDQSLRPLIFSSFSNTNPASPVSNSIASGGVWNVIAGTNKIDQLTGTSITNATVHGLNGLTASDIPSLSYLPLSGGTITGDATLGSTTVGVLTATDVISKGPTIDVRAYGAKGDGTTDDRSAIQAAIDAASTGGGGRVIFAPGKTYLVGAAASTKLISVNSGTSGFSYCIDLPSNVTLDFQGATLKLKAGTDAVLLSNRNSTDTTDSRIAVLNAVLDGNNVTLTSKALVWFVGVTDMVFNAKVQNTTHIGAQFANITRLYSTEMEAVNVIGQGFFLGSVATNGDVRDSYIGDITTSNISAESQPNFPGNPVAAFMTNSEIGSIEVHRADAGIKIYWNTDRLSIGSVLLQDGGSPTSGNSGFKVQGDGTNNPQHVSVGSVTAQGQYGAGLYIQDADTTHVGSYTGQGNALLGNVPDVWVSGTSTSIAQIHSDNSGNVGVEIRSDAVNYQIGSVDVRDPGQVATAAAVSVDGGTGVIDAINALDDQGTPTMTRGLDVHDASANIRVEELHSSGQSVTPINVVMGATALVDLHGETDSPTQITANQNNYDPSRTAEVWRMSSDASRTITGIAGPWPSRQITISNIGSFNILLANQSVSSTDVYRIITGTGADVTVAPGEVATLVYDATTQRWLLKNHLLSTILLQSPTLSGTVAGTPTWSSGQTFPTITTSSTTAASVFGGGFLSLASSTVTSGLFSMMGGASTTNITASGTGYFGFGAFTTTSGTTTIASGQGFTIGGSQFVVQQGSGNVGIGTASPTRALTVAGSNEVATFGLTTASAYAAFGGERALFGYDSGLTAAIVQGLSGKGIEFNVNSNTAGQGTAMYINTSGSVGVGTTSPWAKLSVAGSAGGTIPVFAISTSTSAFATSTAFVIDQNGLVGIATTSPWRSLSVTGTVGFDGLTGNFGAGSLCLTANKEVVYNSGSDSCLSSLRSTKHGIQPLNLSAIDMVKSLQPVSFIYNNDASSTVRYGFIAEDTAAVDAHLATYDQSGNLSGVDDRALIAVLVNALQSLIDEIGNFAASFTTKELTFTRATGDEIDVNKLCVKKSDGTPVCVNGDQLAAVLAGAGSASASGGSPSDSTSSDSPTTSTMPNTPPVIQIDGDNPGTIHVGDTYADLGATITGPQADLNLGIKTFLNGALVSTIVIDTSAAATDTIDYVATDSAGNAATSTRTVIISAAAQADTASTTAQ